MKKYTCQNGVRIVLENMPILRSVAIGVWIKTGSRMKATEIQWNFPFSRAYVF